MSCVWLTNRRKWSWRFFLVSRLIYAYSYVYGFFTGKTRAQTSKHCTYVRSLGPFWPAVSAPASALQDLLCVVPCGLWQQRGSFMSVGGSHFTPTSSPFHSAEPRPRHQHTGSPPYALTGTRGGRGTGLYAHARILGMAWHGSSMEHRRRTPLSI